METVGTFGPGIYQGLASSILAAIKSPLQATAKNNVVRLWDWDSVASATHELYRRTYKQARSASTCQTAEEESDDTIGPKPGGHISAESDPDVDVARAGHG